MCVLTITDPRVSRDYRPISTRRSLERGCRGIWCSKTLKLNDNDNGNDIILGFYPRRRSLERGCRGIWCSKTLKLNDNNNGNDIILGFYPRRRSLARECRGIIDPFPRGVLWRGIGAWEVSQSNGI